MREKRDFYTVRKEPYVPQENTPLGANFQADFIDNGEGGWYTVVQTPSDASIETS